MVYHYRNGWYTTITQHRENTYLRDRAVRIVVKYTFLKISGTHILYLGSKSSAAQVAPLSSGS